MEKLQYICGVTFAPFAPAGSFMKECAEESLRTMKERTNANFVILVPNGLQDTPQSEEICYTSPATMTDDELKGMIEYAHSLGLRVALKPTANCKNGTWRAHISFFDEDVVCEPKWGNWFASLYGVSEPLRCDRTGNGLRDAYRGLRDGHVGTQRARVATDDCRNTKRV